MTELKDATILQLNQEIARKQLNRAALSVMDLFSAVDETKKNYNQGLIDPYEAGQQIETAARIAQNCLKATVS